MVSVEINEATVVEARGVGRHSDEDAQGFLSMRMAIGGYMSVRS